MAKRADIRAKRAELLRRIKELDETYGLPDDELEELESGDDKASSQKKADPKSEPEADAEPEGDVGPEVDAEPEGDAEPEADVESKADAKSEADTVSEAKPEPDDEVESDSTDDRLAVVKPAVVDTYRFNGPGKAYKYWYYPKRIWLITTDIWAAIQISDVWQPVYVWFKDGKIQRLLEPEEIQKYFP